MKVASVPHCSLNVLLFRWVRLVASLNSTNLLLWVVMHIHLHFLVINRIGVVNMMAFHR